MDNAIIDLAPCNARCNFLESLQDMDAVFHEPLLKAWSKFLQLFVPCTTMLNDVKVLPKSARRPFVLRPAPGNASFQSVRPVLGYQPVSIHRMQRTIFRMTVTGFAPAFKSSWQVSTLGQQEDLRSHHAGSKRLRPEFL
jgi:hypothetical protein